VSYFMTEAVGTPPAMVEGMLESPMVAAMEPLAHTVAYDGRVMLRGTMDGGSLPASWCHSVTVPALVMDGSESPQWLHSSARALVALLPDVSYRTLQGQDHAAAPEAIATVLADFLA
jgi:hypothetical protein